MIFNVVPHQATGHTGVGHGEFLGNYVDWVHGAIDDVHIFQSALTEPEILTLAQAGNPALTGSPQVEPATLQIDAAHPGAPINPMFYGLMIEEINHGLDGGLYGELIQNRVFKDDPTTPVYWSLVQEGGGSGSIALDTTQPVSGTALTTSLRVSVNNGQQMFSTNHGDVVLLTTLTETGGSQISESVTRDSKSGTFFVKVVNMTGSVQPIHITVNGISGIQPNGKTVVLTSGSPQDTNTLSNPQNVVPSTRPALGMSNDFNFNFAPNSVTVFEIGVHL